MNSKVIFIVGLCAFLCTGFFIPVEIHGHIFHHAFWDLEGSLIIRYDALFIWWMMIAVSAGCLYAVARKCH